MEGFLKRNIKNFIKKKTPIMALAAVLMLSLMFVFISSNIFADTYDYDNPTYKWNVGKDQSRPVWAYYFKNINGGTLVFKSDDPNNEMIEFTHETDLISSSVFGADDWITDIAYEFNMNTINSNDQRGYFFNSSNANNNDGTSDTIVLTPWSLMEMKETSNKVEHVVIEDSFKLKSGSFLFSKLYWLIDITGLDLINTSSNISCEGMFCGCYYLESIDFTGFDTSNVKSMYGMFYDCENLLELDLSNFNTSNVTNMSCMFGECESLVELDISSFNTSKVTDMNSMFYDCYDLIELDLSSFDTSNVTNMSEMFYECECLLELDFSNFNTSNVTNMSYMFSECESFTELDISSFNTSKVTDMTGMFSYCYYLRELDLSNFDTSNVMYMDYVFYFCEYLDELDLSNFDTSKVITMEGMFKYCCYLRELDISSFEFNKYYDEETTSWQLVETYEMLYDCCNLDKILLPKYIEDGIEIELDLEYELYKGDTLKEDASHDEYLCAKTDEYDNARWKSIFALYLIEDEDEYSPNEPISLKLISNRVIDHDTFESNKASNTINLLFYGGKTTTLYANGITDEYINGMQRSIIDYSGFAPSDIEDNLEISDRIGDNYSTYSWTGLTDLRGNGMKDAAWLHRLHTPVRVRSNYFFIEKNGDENGGTVSDLGKWIIKQRWIAKPYKTIKVTVNPNYKAEIYKNDTLLTTLTTSGKYKIKGIENFDDGDTIKVKFISTQINPPGGGGGGGGGATPTYKITNVNDSVKEISKSSQSGSKISLVAFTNRKVSEVLVTDKKGNKIDVTQTSESTFTFKMPSSDVNVEVKYEEREILLFINKMVAYVDKTEKELDTTPILRNDRTMLPIRFVAENLDAEVTWDEEGRTATITEGETKIVITIGSNKVLVNDKEYELDVVPFIENDRTYLPVRFVSEHLNAKVDWYEPEKKVTITKK